MEGHQRNLALYDRFNARVAGVSRDDVKTLEHFAEDLGITFPLLSNVGGYLGMQLGALREGRPTFDRLTVVFDRSGRLRYARSGSPDYHEILRLLKRLDEEEP